MSDVLIKAEGVSKKFCKSLKRLMFYGVQDIARSMFKWQFCKGLFVLGDYEGRPSVALNNPCSK